MRLEQGRTVCTIAPACVMPAMTGRTQDVDQALCLRRLPGPCWAIAHVLGRAARSWYRLAQGLGRFRLGGTTVKSPEPCPQDLVADAKPSWLQGERVDSATTAAHACIRGASVAPSASQVDGEKASGVCASAGQVVDAAYAPLTVKTDGWQATPGAWKTLGTQRTVSLCFRHAFLTSRARATTTLGDTLTQVQKRVGEAYHAPSKRALSQRLRRLRAWAETARPDGVLQSHTLDLCRKRAQCRESDNHPEAHRPSHRVERLMKLLDRALFHAQYCHGRPASAESRVRA